MTFLNSLLALGALAFTVPLAIHLLFRSRYRTVDWGAMHLLQSVVRTNRRRLQLLQILLLILRCMVPVLLALCLARPLLTGFQSLPGDAPQSLVLVVDDSRSMAAELNDAGSRVERAKRLAGELLSELDRSDEVLLLTTSDLNAVHARISHQEALRRVNRIEADGAAVPFERVMQAASRALREVSHANQRIVVLSDYQAINFNNGSLEALQSISSQLPQATGRPSIALLDVTAESSIPDNLYVESVKVDSPAIVAGREAAFEAVIRNDSDRPVTDVSAVWSIDGMPLRPARFSIEPQSTSTVRLRRKIESVGSHRLSLQLKHSDSLNEDNERSIGVEVIEQVDVLLVDGDPSRQPLQSETDFLAIALSPFAFGGEDQPDAVRVRSVRANNVIAEFKKQSPDLVVLANVASIDANVRERLGEFVAQGGSLIIFDGENVRADDYNQQWGKSDAWRLPANLGLIAGDPTFRRSSVANGDPVTTEFFPIESFDRDYSPWQILGGSNDQPFANVLVSAYRKLQLADSSPAAVQAADEQVGSTGNAASEEISDKANRRDDVRVLLRYSNGDPLAVKAGRGRGTVVQFAVTGDADWSNLPLRPVFLPMIQQLVLDLVNSTNQLTVGVDQSVRISAAEVIRTLPLKPETETETDEPLAVPKTFVLRGPDGFQRRIQPPASDDLDRQQALLQFSTTAGPGLYRIVPQFDEDTPADEEAMPSDSIEIIRVAQVPASESRLQSISRTRLASAAEVVGASVYADLPSLQQDDQTRRFGREIWRWLLALLLLVMLAELFVQQRQSHTSIAGAA